MNSNIIITGTPCESWVRPALELAEHLNSGEQEDFQCWHDALFTKATRLPESWPCPLAPQDVASSARESDLPETISRSGQKPLVLADPRSYLTAEALVTRFASGRILAFYALPEEVLGYHAGAAEPSLVLEAWKHSARALISLIRRHRAKITLLSTTECRADPEGMAALLREKFALKSALACNQSEAPALLALALGLLQASADHEVSALQAELEAASEPLSTADAPPRNEPAVLARQGWDHLREQNALLTRHTTLVAERDDLAARHRQLFTALEDLQGKQSSLVEEHNDLTTRYSSLMTSHEALAKSAEDAAEESELLLLQLHQVQEELEHYFLENRRLQRQKLAGLRPEAQFIRAEALRLGAAHEAPPHRHLNYILENVHRGSECIGDIQLRLVEHHSHPGMAILQSNSQPPPLKHWKPSGEENGRPYMLFVPRDRAARDLLAAAPACDLLLLREGACLLATHLALEAPSPSAASKQAWVRIARRFAELVDDLPPRLHYDDVETSVEKDAVSFTIRNAWCPGHFHPHLELSWHASTLTIRRPRGFPNWVGWPSNDIEGQRVTEAIIDLGTAANPREAKEFWSQLTTRDRLLVKLIVAELPNFIYHLSRQHPQGQFHADRLRAEASRMSRRATAYAAGRRPKRFLGLL